MRGRQYSDGDGRTAGIAVAVGVMMLLLLLISQERRIIRYRNIIYWREEISQGKGDADSLRRLEKRLIGTANERWDMQEEGKPKYPFFWQTYNEGSY